jgi:hypothetical protein
MSFKQFAKSDQVIQKPVRDFSCRLVLHINMKVIRNLKVVREISLEKKQEETRETITTKNENPSLWYIIYGNWSIYWDIDCMSIANDKSYRTYLGGSYGLTNDYNTVIIICNTGLRNFKKLFGGKIVVIFNRDDLEYNQTDRDGNLLPTTEQQKRIIKYLNEYVSKWEPIGTLRY